MTGRLPIPERAPATQRDADFAVLLPLVTRWAFRLGAGRIDAEAAAGDALLVIVERWERVNDGRPIEAFAWGVITRVVADHRRRAWWRRWVHGADVERQRGAPDRSERAALVLAILDALSGAHREVLVLMDIEERTAGEVSTLLDLPEGTVRSRLRLARAAFRAEAARRGFGLVHLLGDDDDA